MGQAEFDALFARLKQKALQEIVDFAKLRGVELTQAQAESVLEKMVERTENLMLYGEGNG